MFNDFPSIADGHETIRLWRPGSDFERRIEQALLRPKETKARTAIGDRVIPRIAGHWYLPDGDADETPRVGDRIEDAAGNDWLIERLVFSSLAGSFRCTAFRYDAVFGPDEFVDLLQPVYMKTAGGVLEERFEIVRTGIAAKFSDENIDYNPREAQRRRELFMLCRERIDPVENAVFRRGDGMLWKIRSARLPRREGDWCEFKLFR